MTCWVTLGHKLSNAKALCDTLADTVPEREGKSLGDTESGAKPLFDARAETLAEVEAVTPGDTVGDAHALNDLLGDSWRHTGQRPGSVRHAGSMVPVMEEKSLGETQGGAQALVEARADALPEEEAVRRRDTKGDLQALNDLLGDTWRHIEQCAGTGRHSG